MKRITCIGANSVAVTELTAPRPGVVMQCRRDSGDGVHRTFVPAHVLDEEPALAALQMSLFEEPVADAR
ncbi:MAG: hypothetical protein V4858_03515 [Pseudomonadota bacterium]